MYIYLKITVKNEQHKFIFYFMPIFSAFTEIYLTSQIND